jgi:hypothetical protein
MRRFAHLVLPCLVVVGVTAGCGDDGDDAAGDVDRYCELVDELDAAGSEAFAEVESDESATEEDYAAAEAEFVEANESSFEELREVAPEEIEDDIATLLAAQDERAAGGEQEEMGADVAEAEERVVTFEEENCG